MIIMPPIFIPSGGGSGPMNKSDLAFLVMVIGLTLVGIGVMGYGLYNNDYDTGFIGMGIMTAGPVLGLFALFVGMVRELFTRS